MSNKEIVQQGLNARKDVRAAEARAEKFRQAALDENDARFYERNKHHLEKLDLMEAKERAEKRVEALGKVVRSLAKERDELRRREEEAHQRAVFMGGVKTVAAVLLATLAREAGWIVPWLAGVITVAAFAYQICILVKLVRKK